MNDVLKELRPRGYQLTPEQSLGMLTAIVSAPRSSRIRRRKAYLIAAASVVAVALGGTAVAIGPLLTDLNPPSVSTSECTPRIRMNGIVYEARTYAEGVTAARIGRAELSACDDNGDNSRGAYFPDHPEIVDVWSLGGVDPSEAVGVQLADGFTVYMALDVKPSERQRILDLLEDTNRTQ